MGLDDRAVMLGIGTKGEASKDLWCLRKCGVYSGRVEDGPPSSERRCGKETQPVCINFFRLDMSPLRYR